MSSSRSQVLQVVLPVPVRHHFDYLPVSGIAMNDLVPGMRVQVPFGRNKYSVGLITGIASTSALDYKRLKRAEKVLDEQPLLDEGHLKLLKWASDYYQYPLGEVIFSSLPVMLKTGKKAAPPELTRWRLQTGANPSGLSSRSKKQHHLLALLQAHPDGLVAEQLDELMEGWRTPMSALIDKVLVTRIQTPLVPALPVTAPETVQLNDVQQRAFDTISAGLFANRRFLLDGITGSGKTEIYLEIIRRVIASGKQALILVPEIGLTPQLIARFRQRLQAHMVVLHSGLSDGERMSAWLQARDGTASIILGTRSAVWTPLHNPGVFIVDEEHDSSYKQQEGFRYSARDIAIVRANNAKVPVILGSATPSLETLHNVDLGKTERIILDKRAEQALLPEFRIVDIRGQKAGGALSGSLIAAIHKVVSENKQVLLYLNRRGYAPVLMCDPCGWVGKCLRCEVPFTVHKSQGKLTCHHCGSQQAIPDSCPVCAEKDLIHVGHGTERLVESVQQSFPTARILRIDRDSTRRKGSMERYLQSIRNGEVDILIGTQMLAKGHHLPGITLVGIIDADRGLYSADFRASEKMAQTIIQVSGRAGRANDPGTVMIQTHFPEHPFLNALIRRDYHTFTRILLQERTSAVLPPYSSLVLIRAEAVDQKTPMAFLSAARQLLQQEDLPATVEIHGPFPAPVEKRAGKFRFQLLLQSVNRSALQKVLRSWIPQLDTLKETKKIRWSVDVDPQEML